MRLAPLACAAALAVSAAAVPVDVRGPAETVAQVVRQAPLFVQPDPRPAAEPAAPEDPDASRPYQPSELVRLALADARGAAKLGAVTSNYRYLTSHNYLNSVKRRAALETVAFVAGSVSTEPTMPPLPVVVAGSGGSLLRIDLSNYAIGAAWERMVVKGSGPAASRRPEPYFHDQRSDGSPAVVTTTLPAGPSAPSRKVGGKAAVVEVSCQDGAQVFLSGRETDQTGTRRTFTSPPLDEGSDYTYSVTVRNKGAAAEFEASVRAGWVTAVDAAGVGREAKAKAVESQALAAWLPQAEYLELCYLTASDGPIVRSDWFIANATIPPVYYDLLGLGDDLKDYLALARADLKLAKDSELRGAVKRSIVAFHNRGLRRFPTVSGILQGYVWLSLDFRTSIDKSDVMANPLVDRSDAGEMICTLPNGLQAYFLVNDKNKRQDVVPSDIALDSEIQIQDKNVYAGRNCMTCHGLGVRAIACDVRGLGRDKIALLVPQADAVTVRGIHSQYFRLHVDAAVAHDTALFTAAVRACNGLRPEVNATQFAAFLYDYYDAPITAETAAAEVGVTLAEMLVVLRRAINVDHSLSGFLSNPPSPTRRDSWERRGFGQLMLLLTSAGGGFP